MAEGKKNVTEVLLSREKRKYRSGEEVYQDSKKAADDRAYTRFKKLPDWETMPSHEMAGVMREFRAREERAIPDMVHGDKRPDIVLPVSGKKK